MISTHQLPSVPSSALYSMTGYGTSDFQWEDKKYRIEIKTLNHRHLDIKVRLPKEFLSIESPLRAHLTQSIRRGSLELKMERITEGINESEWISFQANLEIVKELQKAAKDVQQLLQSKEAPPLSWYISFPEVIKRQNSTPNTDRLWEALRPAIQKSCDDLLRMRKNEGEALSQVLLKTLDEMENQLQTLIQKRNECTNRYPIQIQEKIRSLFEAYPIENGTLSQLIDSRVSQELALLLDRTDIEEEINRFRSHLDHFKKTLHAEEALKGRKLEFILQECGREVNTLGNKAQDFSISEEVVSLKVKLEQLREQILNIE